MPETLKALDQLVAKLLTTIVSTKFWVMVVTMAIGALTIIKSGGTIYEAILGALMVITGGSVYSFTKYRQNIEYIRTNAGRPQVTAPIIDHDRAIETPVTPTPPSVGFEPVVSPPEIDWVKFMQDVANRQDELKQTPGMLRAFARLTALENVGRFYEVNNLDDLYSYARARYDACVDWFKEMSGFDYNEALEKGVPKEYQNPSCPTSDLNLWIRASSNPVAYKRCINDIRSAAKKLNAVGALYQLPEKELTNFWKRYPEGLRTLSYIYNTL